MSVSAMSSQSNQGFLCRFGVPLEDKTMRVYEWRHIKDTNPQQILIKTLSAPRQETRIFSTGQGKKYTADVFVRSERTEAVIQRGQIVNVWMAKLERPIRARVIDLSSSLLAQKGDASADIEPKIQVRFSDNKTQWILPGAIDSVE